MFENVLYPIEIIQVMKAVLDGSWNGPNPESYIDSLLHHFYNEKITDKKAWAFAVAHAVKQLGCLDCVFARLNLECMLDQQAPDTITIKYDRQRLLPGENHGIGCTCRSCLITLIENGGPNLATTQDEMILDNTNDEPYPTVSQIDAQHNAMYASGKEIWRENQKPQLSDERKIEIMEFMRRSGYLLVDTREEAWDRLEKLLKKRSVEQSIIARLAYLIVFDAFTGSGTPQFIDYITPRNRLMGT